MNDALPVYDSARLDPPMVDELHTLTNAGGLRNTAMAFYARLLGMRFGGDCLRGTPATLLRRRGGGRWRYVSSTRSRYVCS